LISLKSWFSLKNRHHMTVALDNRNRVGRLNVDKTQEIARDQGSAQLVSTPDQRCIGWPE
jgi:hypothetical protein